MASYRGNSTIGLTAGDLKDRVTLQAVSKVPDGYGGERNEWATTVASLPAKVEPLSANEQIAASAAGSTVTYSVFIRYRPGLNATMRLLWTPYRETVARALEIAGVYPHDGGREFLRLNCAEGGL